MSEITPGFKVRLEYVLDQVCVEAPDGGSHEIRRFIAEKIMAAAQRGERSLEGLMKTARQALTTWATYPVEQAPNVDVKQVASTR